MRKGVQDELNTRFSDGASLPDDLDERHEAVTGVLSSEPGYRVQQTIGEWHSRQHGLIAMNAFEELKPGVTELLARYDEGPSRLFAEEDFKVPDYSTAWRFTAPAADGTGIPTWVSCTANRPQADRGRHLPGAFSRSGAWWPGWRPRTATAESSRWGAPPGTSPGRWPETYPDAEITGVDVSIRTLEHALRTGNSCGHGWQLYLRAAEDTGFDGESFDLVTSYILLHEMPADAIRASFAEAYRVLNRAATC